MDKNTVAAIIAILFTLSCFGLGHLLGRFDNTSAKTCAGGIRSHEDLSDTRNSSISIV